MWAVINRATEEGLPESFRVHIMPTFAQDEGMKLQNLFALLGFGVALFNSFLFQLFLYFDMRIFTLYPVLKENIRVYKYGFALGLKELWT